MTRTRSFLYLVALVLALIVGIVLLTWAGIELLMFLNAPSGIDHEHY